MDQDPSARPDHDDEGSEDELVLRWDALVERTSGLLDDYSDTLGTVAGGVAWLDESNMRLYAARDGEVFRVQSFDEVAEPLIELTFDKDGYSEHYVNPVYKADFPTSMPDGLVAGILIQRLLGEGPGSQAYEARIEMSIRSVWQEAYAISAAWQQKDIPDLPLENDPSSYLDKVMGVISSAPNTDIEVSSQSRRAAITRSEQRFVERFSYVKEELDGVTLYWPQYMSYEENYEGPEGEIDALDSYRLINDREVVFLKFDGTVKRTFEPHYIDAMAWQIRGMREMIQSGENRA